jgi:hypothetical protein
MNSIIEAQIDYFSQRHQIRVSSLDEFSEDAENWDFKLYQDQPETPKKTTGMWRIGYSKSAMIKSKQTSLPGPLV